MLKKSLRTTTRGRYWRNGCWRKYLRTRCRGNYIEKCLRIGRRRIIWGKDADEVHENGMLRKICSKGWQENVWEENAEKKWEFDAVEMSENRVLEKCLSKGCLKGPENRVKRICLKKDSEENIQKLVLRKCSRKICLGNFWIKKKKRQLQTYRL